MRLSRLAQAAAIAALILGAWLPTARAEAPALKRLTNNEGQVSVQVTPPDLAPGAAGWRFAIVFDTHVKPLNDDLLTAASLRGTDGKEEAPTGWEGDPAGGHHRKGVLIFKPIEPLPQAITLTLRGVGSVAERSFVWTLAPR